MTDAMIVRALRFAAVMDLQNSLSWDIDHKTDCTYLFVPCDNFFYWGTTDNQPITEDNIHEWERAIIDARDTDATNRIYGPYLFCSRMRKMRPQGSRYDELPETIWPLFDECGPEREESLSCRPSRRRTKQKPQKVQVVHDRKKKAS